MSYGYEEALVAAGAKVLEFAEFGDYQGSWIAYVEYEGGRGFVRGSYGSCDHCDAFQGEFGWVDEDEEDSEEYRARLADFGRGYLEGQLWTAVELREHYAEDAEWDSDAEEIVGWLNEQILRGAH